MPRIHAGIKTVKHGLAHDRFKYIILSKFILYKGERKNEKKLIALGLALGMIVSISACGSGSKDASSAIAAGSASASNEPAVELHVSTAASMTESLNEVIANYTKEHSNVKIVPTYDF